MKIKIPNNFIAERKYILEVIVGEFLCLNFTIEPQDGLESIIFILENDKKILIKDAFFNNFVDENYLSKKNIPTDITFVENQFAPEKNIAVLYGNSFFSVKENEIICGNDIFAASFFMLTRWEEHVVKEKDKFERFPENQSLSIRFDFHNRPICDEYTQMLWNMLEFLGCKQMRKIHKYELKITHDIDFFKKYSSSQKILRAIIGDILNRKSIKLSINTLFSVFRIKFGKEKDPFDVFDFFMEISEKHNLKSHFYFIAASAKEKETTYNIEDLSVQKLIANILKRGHYIGFHAGWNSFLNPEILKTEKLRLEKIAARLTEGRQHYLRFDVPQTWQDWENLNFSQDSSMGFSKNIGFRAGTSHAYSVFNILSRKKLNLKECPLIAMDTALKVKFDKPNEIINNLIQIKKTIKKYNGTFILLWHNNNINSYFWQNYKHYYAEIINKII